MAKGAPRAKGSLAACSTHADAAAVRPAAAGRTLTRSIRSRAFLAVACENVRRGPCPNVIGSNRGQPASAAAVRPYC